MRHGDHIQRVLAAGSMDALERHTADFAAALGFEHHGYAMQLTPSVAGRVDYRCFHNYAGEWGATYPRLAQPEVACNDARVLHARTGRPGIAWNTRGQFGDVRPMPSLLPRARRQVQMAGEFGMSAGVTIPSWSRGLDWSFLTFSTDATHDVDEIGRETGAMVYFVSCMQASFDRLTRRAQPLPRLSAREREVLCWSAIGKTSWEISMILRIGERTVNFHLHNAARKLQVTGRRAACARAVALGLIVL